MPAETYKKQNTGHLATRNDLEAIKTELKHENVLLKNENVLIKKDIEYIKHQLNTYVAAKHDLIDLSTTVRRISTALDSRPDKTSTNLESKLDYMVARLESKTDQMYTNLDSSTARLIARMDKLVNDSDWLVKLYIVIFVLSLVVCFTSPSVQHLFHRIFA